MKRLTEEEFGERSMALQRAYNIFIESGLTKNITTAFAAYQAIFAERERQIFLSSESATPSDLSNLISRRYERIKCEDCDTGEFLFRITTDKEIPTQLVCSNPACDTVLDSEHEISWWIQRLKYKPVKESEEYEHTTPRVNEAQQARRHSGYRTRDTKRRMRLVRQRIKKI